VIHPSLGSGSSDMRVALDLFQQVARKEGPMRWSTARI
jgi:hypothetical protein